MKDETETAREATFDQWIHDESLNERNPNTLGRTADRRSYDAGVRSQAERIKELEATLDSALRSMEGYFDSWKQTEQERDAAIEQADELKAHVLLCEASLEEEGIRQWVPEFPAQSLSAHDAALKRKHYLECAETCHCLAMQKPATAMECEVAIRAMAEGDEAVSAMTISECGDASGNTTTHADVPVTYTEGGEG